MILFENKLFVAVDKPSGVLVILDRWKKEKGKTLLETVQKSYAEKIYVVHRLDRETSGIVLFAKDVLSHRHLSMQFEKREVTKTYVGLVHGVLPRDEGIIRKPLSPSRRVAGMMIVDKREGKPAETSVKVVERFKEYTWCEFYPLTGRTHQIRVHCTSIGYPLVCDPLYGLENDAIYLSQFKKKYKKKGKEKPLLNRLALHALNLTFKDPLTGEGMTLEAPLPKDLKATLLQLRKNSLT